MTVQLALSQTLWTARHDYMIVNGDLVQGVLAALGATAAAVLARPGNCRVLYRVRHSLYSVLPAKSLLVVCG